MCNLSKNLAKKLATLSKVCANAAPIGNRPFLGRRGIIPTKVERKLKNRLMYTNISGQ